MNSNAPRSNVRIFECACRVRVRERETDDFERVELPERHASDVGEIRVVVVRVIEELGGGEYAREQQSVHV